jgi:hypothetical protein
MPRVTSAALRAMFPKDDPSRGVEHYILDASTMVEEFLGSSSHTEGRLTLIEKYLAAHFYLLGEQEGGVFEEKIGESNTKMGSTFTLGQGLRLTRYGQMVLSLDSTGSFEDIAPNQKARKALFRVV